MSMRWARTRHDGCQQHNAQRTYATSTTRCAPSWRASFFVARPRASTAMMQGQGGKRGPDRNPRKRKKETKAAKQRKAKNKKLHAQAQSKAAKRGLIQLMAAGVSLPTRNDMAHDRYAHAPSLRMWAKSCLWKPHFAMLHRSTFEPRRHEKRRGYFDQGACARA